MTIEVSKSKSWKSLIFPPHKVLSAFTQFCVTLGLFTSGLLVYGANPTITPADGFSKEVAENTTDTGIVIEVSDDVDLDSISSVQIFGEDASFFNLVDLGSDQYNLKFITAPDYEGFQQTFVLAIKATDSSNETATVNYTINIADVNEGPVITSPNTFHRQEVTASNPDDVSTFTVTTDIAATAFSVSGGVDQAAFSIDNSGVLVFNTPPDYDSPHDSDKDNVYNIQVNAHNPVSFDSQSITITIVDVNEGPVITQPTDPSFSVAENTTSAVVVIDASDPDGESITSYQISGNDASFFTFTPGTGELTFNTAPDYETPKDTNTDNVYEITISARDSGGNSGTLNLFIAVENENDVPTFSIDTTSSLVTDDGEGNITVDGYETRENGGTGFEFSSTALSKITIADDDHGGSGLPSPQLWIKLDETSGITIAESSGNGHAVSLEGGNATPGWTEGTDATHDRPFNALEFNGTTDYLLISDVPALRPESDNYSLTFWLKLDNLDDSMAIFNKGLVVTPQLTPGFLAYFHNDDLVFRATDGVELAHAVKPDIDTDWHHFAAVIDRNSELLTLYIDTIPFVQVNGYVGSTVSDLATMEAIDNSDEIWIGRDSDGNYFKGLLDDVRVYDSPLSVSQVSEIYSEADANTVTVTLQVTQGTISLGDPDAVEITTGDGIDDTSTVFKGTVSEVTTALEGLVYVPNDEYNGTDTFLYHVQDTDDNGTKILDSLYTFNVQAINDVPENQTPLPQTVDEGGSINFRIANGNGISISDDAPENSEGDNDIQVTLTAEASTGTITLGVTAGLTFQAGDGTDDAAITFKATLAEANAALDSLTYSLAEEDGGNPDFSGTTTLTISTNDLGNYGLDDIPTPSQNNDSQQETDTDEITINVTAINDPISFVSGDTSVTENTTAIFQIEVDDPDLNDNPSTETTTFTKTGGDDASLFNLATDGTLTFTEAMDFEAPRDQDSLNTYEVTIEIEDSAGNTAEKSFTITVTDLNESPSIVDPTSTGITVVEGFNSDLTTVSYSDPEDESVGGGTLTLTLSGEDADQFALDTGTGVLTFVSPPDFESPQDANADNLYEVSVVATDSATPTPNTDTVNFAITVTDQNDAPSINLDDTASNIVDAGGGDYTITGFEASVNGDPGFIFSSAGSSAITITDSDYDASGLPSPTLWLKFDETSGTSIDDSSANNYTVTLQGGNSSPSWTSGTDATHNREFQALHFNGSTDYVRVNDATALRPASGSYTIAFWFKADNPSNTQALFAKGTTISTTNTEGILAYLNSDNAIARAADGNDVAHAFSSSLSSDWHHFAATLDRNFEILNLYLDSVKYAQQTGFEGSNTEDLSTMDAISNSSHIQIGTDGTNYYAGLIDDLLVYNTPLNASQVEELYNSNTPGELELTLTVSNGTLTLGDPATEGLTISAGDGNDDASMTISGSTAILNDALDGLVYTPNDDYNGTDTLDLSLVDTDDNGTQNASVSYDLNVQAVNRAPEITLPTDQSVNEGSSITFQASSSNAITIADDADENPSSELEVTLTAQSGTGVLTLGTITGLSFTTGDGDKDVTMMFAGTLDELNAALEGLTFSLVGVDGGDDDFNGSATITIVVNDQANFGADDQTTLDAGQSTQEETTTEILTLTVNPVNDPFTINESSSTMDENTTTAITLTVSDPDDTDTHTFSITGGADQNLFTIDADTGVLSFVAAPDFENPVGGSSDDSNTYEVTVFASDSGALTASKAITIEVFDVNDAPTFVTTTTNYTPLENQTAIVDIDATDQDQDPVQTLQYSIVDGSYSALFNIDSSTGVLTFASAPDFENPGYVNDDTAYDVSILATDDGGSPLSSAPLALTIALADENESPTISTSASLNVEEEQTSVVAITVDDPDAGDSHTYSIVDGVDQDLFEIDSDTGELSFLTAPSFEDPLGGFFDDSNTYEVTIRTTDSGGLTHDQALNITVTDVNDAPVFTIASSSISADENQTSVVTLTAEDEDEVSSIHYAPLSFDLLSGGDSSRFVLSTTSTDPTSATATLSFSPAPDFENPSDSNADTIYTITAEVSDGDIDTEQALTISLANTNDAPVFDSFPTTQTVNEDTGLSFGPDSLNAIAVSDEDILSGGSDTLIVTLSLDGGNGTLEVSDTVGLAVTGNETNNLQLTANPDTLNTALETLIFTGADDYHGTEVLRVNINDQGSNLGDALTTEQTVNIVVNPVNDAPEANFPIGSPQTDEDTPYVFLATTETELTVADVDNPDNTQNLTVTFSVHDNDSDGSADGTLQLAASDGLTFTEGNGISPFSLLSFSGTIEDINTALDGLVFTPAQNFNGTATIQALSSDVSLSDLTSWNLTVNPVNDVPTITLPEPQLLDEDTSIHFRTISNVAQVDTVTFSNGANGDVFTFTLGDDSIDIAFNTTTIITGTHFVDLVNNSGLLPPSVSATDLGGGVALLTSTTPGEPFDAEISIHTNASGFASASVVTTIHNVTDNTISIDDDASETDSDVEVRLSVSHGLLQFSTIDNLTFDDITGGTADQAINSGANLFVFSGTVESVNTALQWIEYTPTANFNGTDTLFLSVDDQGNNGSGGTHIADSSLTITIEAVNDGPSISAPTTPQPIDEDSTLVFNDSNGNRISVTDPDAGEVNGKLLITLDTLYGKVSLSSIAGLTPVTGSLPTSKTMSFTGLEADVNSALNNLQYVPNADHNNNTDLDALTITVNDQANHGSEEISTNLVIPISITPVNDAPIITITNLTPTINEEENYVFSSAAGTPIYITDDAFEADEVLKITISADHGTFTLATNQSLAFDIGDGTDDETMTFSGTEAALDEALDGLTYTPKAEGFGFSGTDELTFLVQDLGNEGTGGFLEASTTVSLTVSPENDSPIHYFNGAEFASVQTATEDTPFIFSSADNNAITLMDDAEEAGFAVQTTLSASSGTLTLGDTSGLFLVFTQGDGVEDSVFTMEATVDDINTALDGLIFTPNPDSNDDVVIFVITNDLNNTGSGGAKSDSDIIPIVIDPVNDAPDIVSPASTLTTIEDVPYTFSGSNLFTITDDASEEDLDISVTISADNGTITLGVDDTELDSNNIGLLSGFNGSSNLTIRGPVNSMNLALNGLIYSPNPDYVGTDNFNVVVNDLGNNGDGSQLTAEGLAVIQVDPVNDAPKLVLPGEQLAFEDISLTFSDAHSNEMVLSDVDEYGPSSAAQTTLTLVDEDGFTVNNRGTLTLATRNNLFFTSGDGINDYTMTFQSTLENANIALNGMVYTPADNYSGDLSIKIRVNDQGNTGIGGALSVEDIVTIHVAPTNDAPILLMPSSQSVNEDGQLLLSGSSIQIFDDASFTDEILVSLLATNATVELGSTSGLTVESTEDSHTFYGTLTQIATAFDGITVTPTPNFNGEASLSITVNDEGAGGQGAFESTTETLDITVISINDIPTLSLPASPTVQEGSTISLSTHNGNPVTFDDIDVGSGEMQITLESSDGILSLGSLSGVTFVEGDGIEDERIVFTATLADGNAALQGMTYSPNPNPTTVGRIFFSIVDQGNSGNGGILSTAGTLTINIDKLPPVISQGDSLTVTMKDNLPSSWVQPTLTATDPNNEVLTWSLHSQASSGTATVTGTGSHPDVNYVPSENFSGEDAFIVKVTDASGNTDTILLNVVVNAPPIFTTSPILQHSGGDYSYPISVHDIDLDDSISITSVVLPEGITLQDHGNRTATVSGTFANPGEVTPWSDAVDIAAEWKQNWFGIFHIPDNNNGWIYHAEHGWVYSESTDPANFWFWTERLGWTWTSRVQDFQIVVKATDGHSEIFQDFTVNVGVYPFYYSNDAGSWLYYQKGSIPAQVYFYEEERWTNTVYSYNINGIAAGDTEGGIITGSGVYDLHEEVTLTATPLTDYNFLGWTGEFSSSSNSITVTADKDQTFFAHFEAKVYHHVNVQILDNTSGSTVAPGAAELVGDGRFEDGTNATVTVLPTPGYIFQGWTGDTATLGLSASELLSPQISFTVLQTYNLQANFIFDLDEWQRLNP